MTKKRDYRQIDVPEHSDTKRRKSIPKSTSHNTLHSEKKHHTQADDQTPPLKEQAKNPSSSGNLLSTLGFALEQVSTAASSLGDVNIVAQAETLRESLFSSQSSPIVGALDRKLPEFLISARIPSISAGDVSGSVQSLSQRPPLPPIQDPDLEKAVFTHSSTLDEAVTASNNPAKSTYERLEFLGDAYIEIISTRLIHSRFPTLPTGRQAQIREKLVRNEALAEHAQAYSFQKRVNMNNDTARAATWIKVLADVFEAYVAAIILADPQDGFVTVECWLKALWAPALLEVNKVPTVNVDAKNELSRMIVSQGVKIEYVQDGETKLNRKTGTYTFKVSCYLTGWGYEKQFLGTGEADNKKRAGMLAASDAMTQSTEILRVARSKKLEFDQKRREEKEKIEATKALTSNTE